MEAWRSVGGRRKGEEVVVGGVSLETLMLETSDAQLGVQAGGWEIFVWSFSVGGYEGVGVCMIVDRMFA